MYPLNYDVSLRVRHPAMDSEEICAQLGLQARWKWTAGTQRKTPKGIPLKGEHSSTYCCFDLENPAEKDLVDFLGYWNTRLYPHKQLFQQIRSTGGSLEYFIGLYLEKNSGAVLNLSLLDQLVDLGIELSLDLYVGPRKRTRLAAGTRKLKTGRK